MTRQPFILAICPTTEPTAPEAAATTSVSPGLRFADVEQAGISGETRHPKHAQVRRRSVRGAGSTFCTPLPSESEYSCQPVPATTMSPVL